MGYVIGDCSLGDDLRFEIPTEYTSGDLIIKDGDLFNATSGTIYLYCDQFPDYQFRLSSFSGLEYRKSTSSGYTFTELPFSVDTGPVLLPVLSDVILFATLLISALIVICKGGARRG